MASREDSTPVDAAYRWDDWFDHLAEDTEPEDAPGGRQEAGADESHHEAKAARLAEQILAGVAPALCGETYTDSKREPVELSAPEVYPPGDDLGPGPVRVNETDGYLSGGESTFVVRDGLSTEELLGVIDLWLAYCQRRGRVGPDLADTLRRDAQRMKRGTDKPDEEIVRRIVQDALAKKRGLARQDM